MAKCGIRGCDDKVVGGFERHVYATGPDVTPTIIDKPRILWCTAHETALKGRAKLPGRRLTQKDIDGL